MHEHFDADGVKTGITVITREPRVDAETRTQMFALDEYEAGLCKCGCGQPLVEAADPKRAFKVRKHVCHAQRAIERVKRAARDEAERQHRPESWDDGATWLIESSFPIDEKGSAKRGN